MITFPSTQLSRQRWSPSDITTIAWYDPSDLSTISDTGGLVDVLSDKSGNSEDISATLLDRPITNLVTINGLNALRFDGTTILRKDSFNLPASGDNSVFAVSTITTVTNGTESLWSFNASPNFDYQFRAANSSQFNGFITQSGIGSNIALTGGPFTGPSIFNINFNFTSSFYNAFVDGTQRAVNTAYTSALGTVQSFKMSANRGGARRLATNYGELIIVEDVSDSTREIIEGYLSHKWGITLPISHPYKLQAPFIYS